MSKDEFLEILGELAEAEKGDVTPGMELKDLIGWDSLAVMGFIAEMDDRFDLVVSTEDLASCKTVDDLMRLAGPHIKS